MINKNKAFTLVELIVVITILAILGTIAFLSLQWYNRDALKSKIISDLRSIHTSFEVKMSQGKNFNDLIIINRMTENWVDTWATVFSWAKVLWDLDYWAGTFNYKNLRLDWNQFKYDDRWEQREYLFWFIRTPSKIYYEFVGQTYNQAWKYELLSAWNYYYKADTDSKWLISENWYNIWLKNWDILTWSLY